MILFLKGVDEMSNNENVIIKPANVSFCFSYSELDCYKLSTGKCTFELTDEEYHEEESKCKSPWYAENRVGYCRDLFSIMKEEKAFTTSTQIRGTQFSCEHISLTDGQHRSCISKMTGAASLFFDKLDQVDFPCSVCQKPKEAKKAKSIFKNLLKKREKTDEFFYNKTITFEELSTFEKTNKKSDAGS